MAEWVSILESMNTKELKQSIKQLGFNVRDFSVRLAGLSTDVKFTVKSKNPDHRVQDFAQIEKLMPWGRILVYDCNGTTCNWDEMSQI